ncbi:MAG TPA: hypothetical protein VGD06_05935 [Acidobacteriota bacterium]
MARKIGAVLAGIVIVFAVVIALQFAGMTMWPPPEGLDPMDPADREGFNEYIAGLPVGAWALVFASEVLGAFLGALAAAWIAGDHRRWFAGGIVAVALAGSVMNWMSFPHPPWFIFGQLFAYPLAFLVVVRILGPRPIPSRGMSRPLA